MKEKQFQNVLLSLVGFVTGFCILLAGWKSGPTLITNNFAWSVHIHEAASHIRKDITVDCDIVQDNSCYRLQLTSTDLNFPTASFLCANDDSAIATIDNMGLYGAIVDAVRRKMQKGWQATSVWINVTGTMTEKRDLWYLDGQIPWSDELINFYLVVDQDQHSTSQGLRRGFALSTLRGVVCEKII